MNEKEKRNPVFEGIRRFWKGIDMVRRIVLNIVFFLLLFYFLGWYFAPGLSVPSSAVLVVQPRGAIVEQMSIPGISYPVESYLGMAGSETLLKDLTDSIRFAKDDDRIKAILLDLRSLGGAGLTKLQDLGGVLKDFRKSGKKVLAYSDFYTRNRYYLASFADEIAADPMGIIVLEGYSLYRRYYKDALDALGVEVNIMRVGKYKSAVEPYMRNDMSVPAKASNLRWLNALWDQYLNGIAEARGMERSKLADYIENYTRYLKDAGGDTATAAKNAGIIDRLMTPEQLRQTLIAWSGGDKEEKDYKRIHYLTYLDALDRDRWGDQTGGDAVGIIVARGEILDGYRPQGEIGGDSTAALIRRARLDDSVKALVVRLDTGGGSTFASEKIRRELELVRKEGKPVVVSMGSVTASGGYWVSMAADEIYAYNSTITGSIGIYGIFPTFQETLKKYMGTHVDGVSTTKIADVMRMDRKMSLEVKEAFQMIIDRGYDDFISIVAKQRNKEKSEIHEIAQGRVWIGSDALKLGLVDKIGNLNDAVIAAAKRAKLEKTYNVKYIRPGITLRQQLIAQLVSNMNSRINGGLPVKETVQPLNPVIGPALKVIRQIKRMAMFNDPRGIYAYCLYDFDF